MSSYWGGGRTSVSLRALKFTKPNKIDVQPVIAWISLAKLSILSTFEKIAINICVWFIYLIKLGGHTNSYISCNNYGVSGFC